jgi:hypothetical protein
MLRRLGAGLTYANVMATVALFVALGGGAYAALRLPRNSVGPTQIKRNAVSSSKVKNRSLLAGDFKAGQLPAGPRGLTGAQGQQGVQGLQGIQGERGPAGPTAVFAYDSGGQYDPPADEGTPLSTTTVSLPVAGRLFVTATQKTTLSATGGGGGGPTEDVYGIYVDGQPVPGSRARIGAVPLDSPQTETVTSIGVTGVLAAGQHQVRYSFTNSGNLSSSSRDEHNLVAVLIGG